MIRLRLDRRLQGRVDPSDVLQEAYIDLARKLPEYASKPPMPFFLWLRLVAGDDKGFITREEWERFAGASGKELPDFGTGPGHHGDDEYEYEIHHWEK